jgi:hypothetical protein
MCAITQRHEREERPLIIHCWICSIFRAKPALYLRTSIIHYQHSEDSTSRVAHLAWWKPTTVTSGTKPWEAEVLFSILLSVPSPTTRIQFLNKSFSTKSQNVTILKLLNALCFLLFEAYPGMSELKFALLCFAGRRLNIANKSTRRFNAAFRSLWEGRQRSSSDRSQSFLAARTTNISIASERLQSVTWMCSNCIT